ncbi:MAG: exodeoxyribonuclease III [Planctomycetota bacterium]
MKIVTWNVNSIKVRLERVLAFLERESPDALCLQELKCTDEAFPYAEIEGAGYHAAVHGQKTYNGVAILAKQPPEDVRTKVDDDPDDAHARLISAVVDGVRVFSCYFPNGSEVGSEKWDFKRAWMDRLIVKFDREHTPDEAIALTGDFNVAPRESDIAKPEKWTGSVLTHAEVRERLAKLEAWGMRDVFTEQHPDGGVHSWWDYRQLAFPKGNGLRIDLQLMTESVAKRVTGARIDRDERKGKGASDHAPVIVELG